MTHSPLLQLKNNCLGTVEAESSRVLNGTLSKIRTDRRQEQVSDSRNIAKNRREKPPFTRFESTLINLGLGEPCTTSLLGARLGPAKKICRESISCIGVEMRRTSEASGGVAADLGREWSDEARRQRWGDALDDTPWEDVN
ncbi:hypothetical protein F2Q68_00027057 [Brassica cretica]|uniref:Uncharacterized protein n=1 Tax=Brassica cretica TaxID=69181 RepID=A0A8S9IEE3_BRACR|nr:hypothetical protein F2Q68_00027057 [Brassica cretica]